MARTHPVALLAAGLLLCLGRAAEAGVTYDFAFRSTDINGDALGAYLTGGGHTFVFTGTTPANACISGGAGCPVMDVFLINSDPMTAASISVMFDNAGGLGVDTALRWAGQGVVFNMMGNPVVTFAPAFSFNSVGGGTINGFNGFINPPAGPPSLPTGTYNIGTVVWDTSGLSGAINVVMMGILSGTDTSGVVINGNIVDVTGTETLGIGAIEIGDPIPEPITGALLGLGLAGLALARRRRG
jgi:hypothetical protein